MKKAQKLWLPALLLIVSSYAKAQHSITKLWETDSVLNVPESVLPAKDIMYASLIDGEGWTVDGKGEIAKLTRDGKIINAAWITGLNAPKGMGIWGDNLYAADIDELVVISISKGVIDHKIKISGASGLNDLDIDSKGVVYVSDSKNNLVFKVENDKPSVFVENMKFANGVKCVGDKVYVLTSDGMYEVNVAKKVTKITELKDGGDGIEPIGNGDFVVTSWIGYLYYVHADGQKELLLDTHATTHKTADIGYDPKKKIIYVPTFLAKSVVAYQLK